MKKHKLEMFRLRLLAEKTGVLRQLDQVERDLEKAAGNFFKMVTHHERQRYLQENLAEINNALVRIASGTYGLSEVSGKPIPIKRLKELPWADRLLEEKVAHPERIVVKSYSRPFLAD
jgi:RNA polymerase-binding transcription factor DksA